MASTRGVTKQLTCAQCGEIFAEAFYRPLTGTLIITSLADRQQLMPLTPGFELQLAQQKLTCGPDAEWADARRRAEFIGRHVGERIYDLLCRRSHSNLTTAPQITRALRRSAGRWVSLAA
jgi:hypothetical protein